MRPRLARLAAEQSWRGIVRNTPAGVEILLEQTIDPLDAVERIRAIVGEHIDIAVQPTEAVELPEAVHPHADFVIDDSAHDGPLAVELPRDLATCRHCFEDVANRDDRRWGYPLTTCVECGPRFSVIEAMPYDRSRTTLRAFPLCEGCQLEYGNPRNRRFHAQSIACSRCGPQVWYSDAVGRRLRGLGGYQLLCDATSDVAVGTLRRRKRRLDKPFAVLCGSVDEAERLASMGPLERNVLQSRQNPIVLLMRRPGARLAEAVGPGVDTIGILLPTTPLHAMLANAFGRPLVCTSGNADGQPLCTRVTDAEHTLAAIADGFLHHDREIAQPIDESVVRVIGGRVVTLRCARGEAPLPLPIVPPRPAIALGGHLKSAIALSNGAQTILAPHVGDLDSEPMRERWVERLESLTALYGVESPEWIGDAHPDYFSSAWGATRRLRQRHVWHHHAHVAAAMLEHGLLDQKVLGVAFDGTGLGPDGTIWGGEFLLVDGAKFRRIGRLRPMALPGGEAAVRDVRRLAVAALAQLDDVTCETALASLQRAPTTIRQWLQMARSPHTPRSSSAGRLFDAVASLALGLGETAFDGHAAMWLEAACDETATGEYEFAIDQSNPRELDWRPVVASVVRDLRCGEPPGAIAARFHRGLASAIVALCCRMPHWPVVLSGGVFQNRRLVEEILTRWPPNRLSPVWPCQIPPNDGGLAAGQLAVATRAMTEKA
jgi:hydrogenase maturation protein HypF